MSMARTITCSSSTEYPPRTHIRVAIMHNITIENSGTLVSILYISHDEMESNMREALMTHLTNYFYEMVELDFNKYPDVYRTKLEKETVKHMENMTLDGDSDVDMDDEYTSEQEEDEEDATRDQQKIKRTLFEELRENNSRTFGFMEYANVCSSSTMGFHMIPPEMPTPTDEDFIIEYAKHLAHISLKTTMVEQYEGGVGIVSAYTDFSPFGGLLTRLDTF